MLFPSSDNDISADDAKKKADKHRFENDLIVLQSDRAKSIKDTEAMETDLRVLQKKYTDLGFEIKEKQEEMKKGRSHLDFLDEEIHVLRKKINNL